MNPRSASHRLEWVPIRSARSADLASAEPGPTIAGVPPTQTTPPAPITTPVSPAPVVPAWRPRSIAEALEEIGPPRIAALTPEAELIELIKYAAEIEHGLMVQYLYAMYSSRNPLIQAMLRTIAVEEMGHLITVQNLLVAGGEGAHLERYDWSRSPVAPFPLHLEPVSQQLIAKYTACEMPDINSSDIDDAQRELLDDILKDAQASAGMDPERIGLLYMKVYWLLRRDDQPSPNSAAEPFDGFPVAQFAESEPGRHVADEFFKGVATRQAQTQDWSANNQNVIVRSIAARSDALAAVADITEQGEGFGWMPDGHFDRFVAAYKEATGQAELAQPVPTDPWYGPDDAGRGDLADKITSADGEKFARLGDQLYELTLLGIALGACLPVDAVSELRAAAAGATLHAMRALASVGKMIVSVERDQGQPPSLNKTAHLCFSRPASWPPEDDPSVLRARILAVVDECIATTEQIRNATSVPARKASASSVATLLRNRVRPVFEQIPQ